ncbi:MAG TPA: glutamate racemase [Planktothrix sp.]|jgi:glutamate racemase
MTESENQLARFRRIGLFDSGVGGLSVLRRLANLPGAQDRSFVYLGDTARCPYGNREPGEISAFVAQIVTWLETKNVDAIIMACNTSAALARAAADSAAKVPVFDLITAASEAAASRRGKIAVMATASTAKSRAFSRTIAEFNANAQVIEFGCPELVLLAESGQIDSPQALSVLTKYVARLQAEEVETVILGCTHYPFFKRQLESIAGSQMTFLDPAQILSGTNSNESAAHLSGDMYVTGNASSFAATAQICLGYMPWTVNSIEITALERCLCDRLFSIPRESVPAPVAAPVVP